MSKHTHQIIPDSIRTFDHFPQEAICPLCGKNTDAVCVLIEIQGTREDGICQASPVHLWCLADPMRYIHEKQVGIIYTKTQKVDA